MTTITFVQDAFISHDGIKVEHVNRGDVVDMKRREIAEGLVAAKIAVAGDTSEKKLPQPVQVAPELSGKLLDAKPANQPKDEAKKDESKKDDQK